MNSAVSFQVIENIFPPNIYTLMTLGLSEVMPPIFSVFINAETHYYERKQNNQELSLKSRPIIRLCLLWCCNQSISTASSYLCHTLNSNITQHSPPTCLCMKPAVLEISYPGRKETEKKKAVLLERVKCSHLYYLALMVTFTLCTSARQCYDLFC